MSGTPWFLQPMSSFCKSNKMSKYLFLCVSEKCRNRRGSILENIHSCLRRFLVAITPSRGRPLPTRSTITLRKEKHAWWSQINLKGGLDHIMNQSPPQINIGIYLLGIFSSKVLKRHFSIGITPSKGWPLPSGMTITPQRGKHIIFDI